MKKKIAIRKLNRTMLKKEGTKEVYITGKILLDFFGYNDINDLATKRNDVKAQKEFFLKSKYYENQSQSPIILSVTRENNEVRLTGFSDYLPDNITETDSMVFEAIENDSGVIYLLDFIKNDNLLVLQEYTEDHDLKNYNVTTNENRSVRFELNRDIVSSNDVMYWLWDNNGSTELPIDNPMETCFAINGKTDKKTIRIKDSGISFSKLMKAQSNLSGKPVTQEKKLYSIEEKKGEEWVPLKLVNSSLLELKLKDDTLIITDRKSNSFTCFSGE